MARIRRKHNKRKILIISIITILFLAILGVGGYFYYDKILLNKISPIKIKLIGDKNLTLEYGTIYEDEGATAFFRDKDITKDIKVNNKVNYDKLGTYKIEYIASTKKRSKKIERSITIIDTTKPVITLTGGSSVTFYTGNDYVDPGFSASDNYDKDITSSITTTNNIDKDKVGTYEVVYKV